MEEVICEHCHEVQATSLTDSPKCANCGSRSLTGIAGYESVDPTSMARHT